MAATYNYGANPPIDYPRLLIADTDITRAVFQDSEIEAMTLIVGQQVQSSMLYSGSQGQNLPSTPVSYLRIAAYLLQSLASSNSRMASVTQLLDVKLEPGTAAQALRDQAREWLEIDDNAGAFMVIEQCNTQWAFSQRWWSQVQRMSA